MAGSLRSMGFTVNRSFTGLTVDSESLQALRDLVLDRSEIRGLVTLSDLQRLPVRTALFGLFIHLELALTEVLRTRLGSGEGSCPSPWCSNGMLSSVDCSIRLPRAAS